MTSWPVPLLPALVLLVASASAAESPEGAKASGSRPVVERVDFERHVMPLLGRLGCNAGACHASTEGKGGFRLSLFGQSPGLDHTAVAGDPASRRIVVDSPDDSLLLAKPSGRLEHEGGLRLPSDSWEYDLLRRWVAGGAAHRAGSGDVRQLRIEADIPSRLESGRVVPIHVLAEFEKGHVEDVTAFATFVSRKESVATVDDSGQVKAIGNGDVMVTAAYRGAFAHQLVIVAPPGLPDHLPRPKVANLIDEEIDRRLDALGLSSALMSSDAEFLRRATLDVLGRLPSPQEVRTFLADCSPSKRALAIDRLLQHPRRSVVWASKMCDVTSCSVDTMEEPASLRPRRAVMWHDRKRFAENVPYDQIARDVLCATSRGNEPLDDWIEQTSASQQASETTFHSDYANRQGLDLFWRRTRPDGAFPVEDMAELTASALFGLRLHCARCHHHPHDRWSQRDFAGFAQSIARVQFGSSTELRTAMNRQLQRRRLARESGGDPQVELVRVQEVYLAATPRPLVDAAAESSAPPKAPGGPVLTDDDPRDGLADWMTAPENPYFARSFVNRIWAKYFGVGLVEPVDDLSASNPESHPELLTRLSEEFVRSGFDVARIERLILSSNVYQRSSQQSSTGANESTAPLRALPAETLIDALNTALETVDSFGPEIPPGSSAHEVSVNRVSRRDVDSLFRVLGRGDRRSLCDCDRTTGPSLRRPMYLMSDSRVLDKIREGRLARLLEEGSTNDAIIEEFYLATLSRFPRDDERAALNETLAAATNRRDSLTDLVWALINTREFAVNH